MHAGQKDASDRPIFVIGCPRSGTTMLQLMLHAHPRIAIPPETRFVLPAYERRNEFGDLTLPENRLALAEWITGRKQGKFQDLGLDPQEVTRRIVDGPPTLGSALAAVLRAYADRFGKPRWGDKRPGYFQHVNVLLRLFPDAQFVHLIRDGRDCVASLLEMSWYRHDVFHAISTWNEAIDAGRRAAERLGPDSYIELHYERLVADTGAELTRLCDFLGEEYDAAMALPERVASTAVPAKKKWHSRTHGAVDSARVGSWAHRLEPWQLALAEHAMEGRLLACGYEPSDITERPSGAVLARYARVAAHRRLAARKRTALDLWRRRQETAPIAAVPLPPVTPRSNGESR